MLMPNYSHRNSEHLSEECWLALQKRPIPWFYFPQMSSEGRGWETFRSNWTLEVLRYHYMAFPLPITVLNSFPAYPSEYSKSLLTTSSSSTALMSCGSHRAQSLALFSLVCVRCPLPRAMLFTISPLCRISVKPMSPSCMSRLALKIITIWILCTAALLPLRTGWLPTSDSWTQIRPNCWLLVLIVF